MITLIKNGTVITMDNKRKEKIEKLDIVIKDENIYKLEKNYEGYYDKMIDAKGKIVMPGLINSHTHLGMSIFRATNDNLTLQDWLTKKIWPVENKMTEEDIYYSTLLSCVEMIKTGTTCASDMYFGWKGIMEAIKQSKFRIIMSRCLMGNGDKDSKERIYDFEKLVKEYCNDPMVTFSVTPHSMYTCTKDYLMECNMLVQKYNFPIHIHFCENQEEVAGIKKDYNCSPIKALKNMGFLEHKIVLAHGTYLEEDLELLNNNVSIATNPISNLNLGCGIADLVKYKRQGINICLGTDGQGSGNNLNLFKHMSLVADLQKAKYKDSTIMSSYEVLEMATINGAKAYGLEEKIGSIEINKKADIIILNVDNIEIYPSPDLICEIVHNIESNNIITTIINGEILMENRKLNIDVNEEELKQKITKIIKRLNIN